MTNDQIRQLVRSEIAALLGAVTKSPVFLDLLEVPSAALSRTKGRYVPPEVPAYKTLTQSQRWWLQHAQRKGYDHGFIAAPTRALVALEKLKLVERHPHTSRAETQWRVTEAGLLVHPPVKRKRHRK